MKEKKDLLTNFMYLLHFLPSLIVNQFMTQKFKIMDPIWRIEIIRINRFR